MLRPGLSRRLATLACLLIACAPEPAGSEGAVGAEAEAASRPASAAAVARVWLPLGGETFTLELATDPRSRYSGLSRRKTIERNGGMLFVYPDSAPRGMVMRECPVPIDVAFLDANGQVVALWAMAVEPPRAADEARHVYESRLPIYRSGVPARFAIEVAGGRLASLGLDVGARIALDTHALTDLAR